MRAALGILLLTLLVSALVGPGVRAAAGPGRSDGMWPLAPEPDVLRGFEPPPHPYASGHRGVDLSGRPGQPVMASLPGTVAFAGSIGGKPVVTVQHGGRRTTYEPVVASVERGRAVAAGEVLGRLVPTDSHCFPATCLHWGLIHGEGGEELYLDPLSLIGWHPVRLLPLWRDRPAAARFAWTPPLAQWSRPLDWLS